MKKLLTLLLTLSLVLSLTACNGETDNNPADNNRTDPPTQNENPDNPNLSADTPIIDISGGTYEGEYDENGKRSGFGIWIYYNHRYEGYWENDMPNGEGTLFLQYEEGVPVLKRVVQGNWINGYANGDIIVSLHDDNGQIRTFNVYVVNGRVEEETTYFPIEGQGSAMSRTPNVVEGVAPFASGVFVLKDDNNILTTETPTIKQVGDIIQFGNYNWIVLDVQDGKMMIISEDTVNDNELYPYHSTSDDVTWEHSTIRQYLNNEFYYTFSSEEQSRIIETMITNNESINSSNNTVIPGGNNTMDKIFLLSVDEVELYFTNNSSRITPSQSWWWLRSTVHNNLVPNISGADGYVQYINSPLAVLGIRPVLWITQ